MIYSPCLKSVGNLQNIDKYGTDPWVNVMERGGASSRHSQETQAVCMHTGADWSFNRQALRAEMNWGGGFGNYINVTEGGR